MSDPKQEDTKQASHGEEEKQESGGQELEGEIEGQADENVAKEIEDNPLDESSIEKAGEAAKAAQKANLEAAKTKDPELKKKLLAEAANHNKTLQTLQSGTLQGAVAGGGIGLATGAGLGTVVGTVVGGAASVPTAAVGAGVGAGVGAIRGPRYETEDQSQGHEGEEQSREKEGKGNDGESQDTD